MYSTTGLRFFVEIFCMETGVFQHLVGLDNENSDKQHLHHCLHCSISDEKSTDLRNPLISLIGCTITSKCQTITVNKGHDRFSRDTLVNKRHHSEEETPQQSRETTAKDNIANKGHHSEQGTP